MELLKRAFLIITRSMALVAMRSVVRAALLMLLAAAAPAAAATIDSSFAMSVDALAASRAVGGRCHRIRAPPLNSHFELFHIHSFENIDGQARALCESRRVAEHRCDSVARQLRAAMREMAAFDISEGVVNVTLDFSLSFAVTQQPADTQAQKNSKDGESSLGTLTVLPEVSLERTIASHCVQYNINDHACSKMLLDVEKMVVGIWGCEDNSTSPRSSDASESQSFQPPVAKETELTQLTLPLDANGDLDQKPFELLLDTTQDIGLQVALFCREHAVDLSTCGLLLRREKEATRTLPMFQRSKRLNVTSPVSTRLYPVSRRVYIELSPELLLPNGNTINLAANEDSDSKGQLCMFLNYADAPVMCSPELFQDPKYYERYVMPVGHHIFLFAYKKGGWSARPLEGTRYAPLAVDESEWVEAAHFDVVEPTIEFLGVTLNTTEDVSTTSTKRVHLSASIKTQHFDLYDRHHRLCVLHNGDFACMQPRALAIAKDARDQVSLNRSMVLYVPIFNVTRGMHNFSIMLLNEFNNVIAHLGPLMIDVSLESGVEPLVPQSESTFVDPTSFVPRRPRVCPKTLVETHGTLRWICDLWRSEWGLFSQNGEDGVLSAIFRHIGVKHREYVEFGTEDANECNTRFWRETHGWTGLLLDGSHENPAINLHREFVTAENINSLFATHNVSRTFDLLSVDVDFNDFWILDAIALEFFVPRVIVIEYNSHIPPPQARTVKYNATRSWDAVTSHFGASVSALQLWGRRNGYSLVYCESHGVNCFLVRDDELLVLLLDGDASMDEDVDLSALLPAPEELYMRPNFFGKGWSYPNASRPGDEWVWL